jgi:hypothetical protein
MPTGYTYPVENGEIESLKDYAFTCARAFGALISLRDDPLSAVLPDDVSSSDSTYHLEELQKAHDSLKEENLSLDKFLAHVKFQYDWHTNAIQEEIVKSGRIKAMKAKVRAWVPPTPDHEALKNFMASQLDIGGGEDDTMIDYYQKELQKLNTASYKEWKKEQIRQAERDIDYHQGKIAEQRVRVDNNNKWIRELKNAFVES